MFLLYCEPCEDCVIPCGAKKGGGGGGVGVLKRLWIYNENIYFDCYT